MGPHIYFMVNSMGNYHLRPPPIFMQSLPLCWRRHVVGERSILGVGLFLEEVVYFQSTHLRRHEKNMPKKKKNNMQEETQRGMHEDMPNHVRVRVFDNIVTTISQ
jgi:hypothetical protein